MCGEGAKVQTGPGTLVLTIIALIASQRRGTDQPRSLPTAVLPFRETLQGPYDALGLVERGDATLVSLASFMGPEA